MDVLRCPYCGEGFDEHRGRACAPVEDLISRRVRAAIDVVQRDRDAEIRALHQHNGARTYLIGNVDAVMVAGLNLDLGVRIIRNTDAAQAIVLSTTSSKIRDASQRITLPATRQLITSSPAELWALGTNAAGQAVEVLELGPGRDGSVFAQIV